MNEKLEGIINKCSLVCNNMGKTTYGSGEITSASDSSIFVVLSITKQCSEMSLTTNWVQHMLIYLNERIKKMHEKVPVTA